MLWKQHCGKDYQYFGKNFNKEQMCYFQLVVTRFAHVERQVKVNLTLFSVKLFHKYICQ